MQEYKIIKPKFKPIGRHSIGVSEVLFSLRIFGCNNNCRHHLPQHVWQSLQKLDSLSFHTVQWKILPFCDIMWWSLSKFGYLRTRNLTNFSGWFWGDFPDTKYQELECHFLRPGLSYLDPRAFVYGITAHIIIVIQMGEKIMDIVRKIMICPFPSKQANSYQMQPLTSSWS